MKLVDLRLVSETLRVRRLFWLGKQLFWEHKNMKPLQCLASLVGHFEWESEPPVTVEEGLGNSAPALLRKLFMDLEAPGLRPFLPAADFERAARSENVSPPSEQRPAFRK